MIKTKHSQKQKGFIALISAIIISTILLGLTLTTSSGAFSLRTNSLNHELKRESLALAESCMQIALQNISENYYYTAANEIIPIDSEKCTIMSVTYGAEDTTTHKKLAAVVASAEFHDTWSTIETRVYILNPSFTHPPSAQKITILSWMEI